MRILVQIILIAALSGALVEPALAQSSVIDSVDLGLVYRRAVLGRSSVKDQLDLCAEDADKLAIVAGTLKPEAGADEGAWKEWSEALKNSGNDLVRCLRAYKRLTEIAQREINEMRKRWQGDATRPTVSARDTAEFNKFTTGIDAEMKVFKERAEQMGRIAQKSVDDANSALAQRGLGQVLLALPFAEALRL